MLSLARHRYKVIKCPVAYLCKVAAHVHASNVWFGDLGVWVPPVGDHADVNGAGERLAKGFDAMICEARVVSEAVKKKRILI